jgi:hypothetical protein
MFRRAAGIVAGFVGVGIVALGALVYAFMLFAAYDPIMPDDEYCAFKRGGPYRDYGGVPTTTPGIFPISSVCHWPETGEELETVSTSTTVVPLVIMATGLAALMAGGVVVWRARGT